MPGDARTGYVRIDQRLTGRARTGSQSDGRGNGQNAGERMGQAFHCAYNPFAGFTVAARRAWKPTATQATATVITRLITNGQRVSPSRWVNCSMYFWPTNQAN